ncbi:MAG: phosphoglucosamine mutase [Gemmatimonadetes bacterium]|nr:phosphoglucosamine mutase [Gemmatimonadota bacterium]NIO32636.1 phosphoglucosamine mutase [Gemmatimonadota bacterium]
MEFPETLIVSVSGIRGRVGIDLTPDVVSGFAAAFGAFVRGQGWGDHLAIARDSRPSGPEFVKVATAALQTAGCRVSDLGLVPTPTALLAIEELGLAGGIVVTASHNPKEWNALKLASPEGAFLTPEQGMEFLAGLRGAAPPPAASGEPGEAAEAPGAVERHIERVIGLDLVDPVLIAARGLKIVLDCARGAGGVILPALLERLGVEVVGIELEPDGRFTREPEPIPANMGALCERVSQESADLGMAVDPDVDRLALVDGSGRAIGEDYTLALAAKLVLSYRRGPVVANLSTSQIVETVCREAGAEYRQSPVGEAHVAAAMREAGAVVGGEGNGGVILPALHLTRDAPLAVALILQLLAEMKTTLSAIVADYPQFVIVKNRFPRGRIELDALAGELESAFPGAVTDRRDGLHLRWPQRQMWLHCRASGTEPILRVIAEGPQDSRGAVRELVDAAGAIVARAGN